jgi:hypothetical protein
MTNTQYSYDLRPLAAALESDPPDSAASIAELLDKCTPRLVAITLVAHAASHSDEADPTAE